MSVAEVAGRYRKFGYSPIPVNVTVGSDGKKQTRFPEAYKGRDFTSPEDWEGFNGIALRTDGLIVADLDVKQRPLEDVKADLVQIGFDLPPTLKQDSPSGGEHYIYRAPEGASVKSLQGEPVEGMDVRANGGILFVFPTPGYSFEEQKIPRIGKLPEMPAGNVEMLESVSRSGIY